MKHYTPITASVVAIASVITGATAIYAQTEPSANVAEAAFASENAILNTAIPFAIGAREARQSLRGAFGWPTFQEGLVEGVYFRFDPDGYARFAPTPRLDSDVFEVICRPRTYSCMGRKGPLSVILNTRGQLQLKIDGVANGDTFFVSEGVSEIQVPERILQPLDIQLETLLSTGGELIIRRGENEMNRVSLTGFYAVISYLRWIVAKQDYSVLPRGWPVPNAAGDTAASTMTQTSAWNSPMPQPQFIPTPVVSPTEPITAGVPEGVAEVKGELKVLRELLLARNGEPAPEPTFAGAETGVPSGTDLSMVEDHIRELQFTTDRIIADLEQLRRAATPMPTDVIGALPTPQSFEAAAISHPTEPAQQARQLEYLMAELGLDAQTALMILELSMSQPSQHTLPVGMEVMAPKPEMAADTPQDVVSEILAELETELQGQNSIQVPIAPQPKPDMQTTQDYQLLSDYFKSAIASE